MIAFALALGASVSWGAGDFLGGVAARRLPTLTVLAASQVAGLVAIAALVAALGREPFGPDGLALAAAAGAGGAVGLAALYRGLAIGAMAVVAPISACSAALPVAYGLARGERPGPLQLAGIGVALAGVALASRERSELGARLAAGVGLALVAAAGFGWYYIAIDAAAARDPLWAVLAARGAAAALAVVAAGARGSLRFPVRRLGLLVAIGLLDVTANGLLVLALRMEYLSLVSVLASLYPLTTVALAYLLLRERIARVQAGGVALALAGVALISAG